MLNFNNPQIRTAGAYVAVGGLYPFVIGWKLHNGNIPVIRLGGEIEANETGWACAAREAREEAGIRIRPVHAEKTYLVHAVGQEIEPQEIHWDHDLPGEPKPVLVVAYPPERKPTLSLMYLAQSAEIPVPSAEVKGIVLLDQESIFQICQSSVTLGQYLDRGGKAIFKEQFDQSLILEPFIQLRILSHLLEAQLV